MSAYDKLKALKPFKYFVSSEAKALRTAIFIFLNILSALNIFWTAFCAICLCPLDNKALYRITPIGILDSTALDDPSLASFSILQSVFMVFIVFCVLLIAINIVRILFSFSNEENVCKFSTRSVVISLAWVILFTVCCFVFSPINRLIGGFSYFDINLSPVLSALVVAIVQFALLGIIREGKKSELDELSLADRHLKKQRKKWRISLILAQFELLAFAIISAGITAVSLLTNILSVTFTPPYENITPLVMNGFDLVLGKSSLDSKVERTVGFFIFLLLLVTVVALFLSILAICGRSSLFNKLGVFSITVSSVSCLLVGLFGQYYEIVQSLNTEMMGIILVQHKLSSEVLPTFVVKSPSIIYFLVLLGVLAILLLRRPFTRARELEKKLFEMDTTIIAPSAEIRIADTSVGAASSHAFENGENTANHNETESVSQSFDPCPAFTELDRTVEEYNAELEKRKALLFADPTLPSLVDFIVQYARDSRLHLFYTPETIAAFLAGLGSTKLSILQGMSGTGKTSLPKIFAEALYSTCDIVEVESSWRDKNELLGYYNEFSKIYTPKKFTQALYKAALNPDVLTFIILDEMNLSRIEYYFSDFLSLMEHEEDKREIKLLNVPIHREHEGKTVDYTALYHGHTIKIPSNIWFIGTANRDESTYDISDKVYDRAHTLNFDKRAKKPLYCSETPIPVRYLPPAALVTLFEEAKTSISFSVDGNPIIEKVDALLSPYNISFGNRVANQIETFVKIYAACFSATEQVIHEALDTILLSKVVKKLELKSIDDKEHLVSEFEKLGLEKCTEFISSLKED